MKFRSWKRSLRILGQLCMARGTVGCCLFKQTKTRQLNLSSLPQLSKSSFSKSIQTTGISKEVSGLLSPYVFFMCLYTAFTKGFSPSSYFAVTFLVTTYSTNLRYGLNSVTFDSVTKITKFKPLQSEFKSASFTSIVLNCA